MAEQMQMLEEIAMEKPETEGSLQTRACHKLDSGAVQQAKNALLDAGKAPPTAATRAALAELVAVPIDATEAAATAWECEVHAERVQAAAAAGPNADLVKRLCRDLNKGAEAGPSSWRSADIS